MFGFTGDTLTKDAVDPGGNRTEPEAIIAFLDRLRGKMLDVDEEGLDPMDKRILQYMLKQCDGGPVGISSLAVGVGEEAETIQEIYEPYLIQKGFLKRTHSGRVLTRRSYEHFQHKPPLKSTELF